MSYSPVYSSQFINYTEDTGVSAFAVPEGFTAVVRDIQYTVEAAVVVAGVFYQNSDAAPTVWIDVRSIEAVLATEQWQGRVVVPGGGTITLHQYTLGVGLIVYVGGYLIRNTLT